MFLQDPYLNGITCTIKTYCFQEIVVLKHNAKSVTDASIWVKSISKNSNTLEIEHSLLKTPIIIPRYRFHFRSTDHTDKPIGFVNKPQMLFCNRALLIYNRLLLDDYIWPL